MKRALSVLALSVLTLTGCSAAAPAEPAAKAPAAAVVDRTAELTAALGDNASLVTKATETEPGRISVESTVIDPRAEPGSAEARSAIAICDAAASLDDITYVSVTEADGTTFVLYGHPSVPEGICTEV